MVTRTIRKSDMQTFLDAVAEQYDVYAPQRETGATDTLMFRPCRNAELVEWDFMNTDMSPKAFVFPQTEALMRYGSDAIMQGEPPIRGKRLLLNVRPCDAKSFTVLDNVFVAQSGTGDPYWQDKRSKTILSGLACNVPCPTCFCDTVNCGPHHEEGLDLLWVDLADGSEIMLINVLSEHGEALVDAVERYVPDMLGNASSSMLANAETRRTEAEERLASNPAGIIMAGMNGRTILELFEDPYWDRVFETCINCGTCTFVCPTCHCFDIQDETADFAGGVGRRIRNWDYCMASQFTLHASGHNPRGKKKERVRQRFMHKFKYMPMNLDGAIGCVGCGRCSRKCPVNIDVCTVVNSMNR